VNALGVLLFHGAVAFGAGHGEVEFENWRLGVRGGTDIVAAVTIGADRRLVRAGGYRASMHTLLVGEEGLGAVPAAVHHELLPVTRTTGGGDSRAVHARGWIAGRQDLVRAAVAIEAARRLAVALAQRFGV